MKQIIKIMLLMSILFLIIGVVSAEATVNDFKAPNGLEPMGKSSFVDKQGHNIQFVPDTDDSHKTWFENDTDYIVEKYNATCYLASDNENDCYLIELVDFNGEKYIVYSWTANGPGDAKIIQDNLDEFNKLNNLKPLEV